MFSILLISFPCITSILMVIVYALRQDKTSGEKLLLALAACSAVYFFAETNYINTYEDYHTLVVADILSQFARPMVPPLFLLYISSMVSGKPWRKCLLCVICIAVMLGTVSLTIYSVIGLDNAARYIEARTEGESLRQYSERIYWMHNIFCVYVYRLAIVIPSLMTLGYIIWIAIKIKLKVREYFDFLFRGGEIEPVHLISAAFVVVLASIPIKIWLGRSFFLEHQVVASLFTVFRAMLVLFIGYVGLMGRRATVTLKHLRNGYFTEPQQVSCDKAEEQAEVLVNKDGNREDIKLDKDLILSMHNEAFRDPYLTLDKLASQLGTNRTYLSELINRRYGCSYREYISSKRVEYAKMYMIQHPDAVQEDIAIKCGFVDAPAFCKKFKQVVNQSPRMWLLMNIEKENSKA